MSYQPREFWEGRLSEQFDLRGTGQPGLSLAYNRACYELRLRVLDRALHRAGMNPAGRDVLDVGCGTGFFTAYYLGRQARVTGLDIAPSSIERLAQRFPEARFILGDVSEVPLSERYDIVNAFDVLYHITDDARWEKALENLAQAVRPGGLLLLTDVFVEADRLAEHNRTRPLERYQEILRPAAFVQVGVYPTHVLLNRELGPVRFLNRLPQLLYALDRMLLSWNWDPGPATNRLLVSRREARPT